jgi:hypothetical protein
MTVPLMRVGGEFAVARPIPWDEDDSLRAHIDRVVDSLTGADDVVEVATEVELDEGQVQLSVVVAGADQDRADRIGRERMAESIRHCDGRHFQLLGEQEEAELANALPSRSGLLTPLWRLRTLATSPVELG